MAYKKIQDIYSTATQTVLQSVARLPFSSYLQALAKNKYKTPISQANTPFQRKGAETASRSYLKFISK